MAGEILNLLSHCGRFRRERESEKRKEREREQEGGRELTNALLSFCRMEMHVILPSVQ